VRDILGYESIHIKTEACEIRKNGTNYSAKKNDLKIACEHTCN
jgi:hypothetical protein